ncbi:hypothetical protein G4B88_009631 [Cannabis sativa]|uniref:Uncharacterized protein n=1 Tax=Cannabis sativa TaxID=3483 RepID=A0A7J6FCJ4_CANSA|nr:hypothetical protein G4B88_009631 [Cannabis sativa]
MHWVSWQPGKIQQLAKATKPLTAQEHTPPLTTQPRQKNTYLGKGKFPTVNIPRDVVLEEILGEMVVKTMQPSVFN